MKKTEQRSNIPLKNRMVSSIPQLRKGPVKPIINIAPKKKSVSTPNIRSTKEYPKVLEELLWKTPIEDKKQTVPAADTIVNYVDMLNDLNSICFISIANTKYTCLNTETQLNELQMRMNDVKAKLNGLYEKNQIQLDLQRAMLSYLKINNTQDAISELHSTNETIMLTMNEILVLNQQLQHLEAQYTQQLTTHFANMINEQQQKTKAQEFLIQDVFCKLKDLLVLYPEQDTTTSHTSTSSSSSNGSKTSCLSFSTTETATSASTEGIGFKEIIDRISKQLYEKKLCESLLKEHKKSADLVMTLNLPKIKEQEDALRRELAHIKETIFIDICKEPKIKSTHDIKPSIRNYIHQLHETYITRESGYILQSASLELQLQKVMKEYDYLTRNLVDFKLERTKYQQEIKKLKLEKYHYLTELNDYKVIRLNESKLRKEFRELMKTVKENHKRDMLVELKKQRELEQVIKEMKEDEEIKKWEKVDKSVQTNYPLL